MFNRIVGCITFEASGANTFKLIGHMQKNGIIFLSLRINNEKLVSTVRRTDYQTVMSLCKELGCELTVIKKTGLSFKLERFKKRYGFIAGIIIAALFVLLLSNTLLKIRIVGTDNAQLNEYIRSVLESNGIKTGCFIPNVDCKKAEIEIRKLDGVAWASVGTNGSIMTVNIYEEAMHEDIVPSHIPSNIVADREGQIVDAKVYVGQLSVLIGDGVKKGQVLVSGKVEENMEGKPEGAEPRVWYYHSIADITAEYKDTVEFTQPFVSKSTIDGDNIISKKYINLFEFDIPLFFSSSPDGEYRVEEIYSPLYIAFLKLPIGIRTLNYIPQITSEKVIDYDEAIKNLEKQIQLYEANNYNDCDIISKSITETVFEDKVVFSVEYVVRGKIGISQEIIKN